MKCPKCEYLGFETGDRCRNCGYDFSLMLTADALPDLDLRAPETQTPHADAWLQDLDRDLLAVVPPLTEDVILEIEDPFGGEPAVAPEPTPAPVRSTAVSTPARITPASLPLFTADGDDDAPLVKLPATPRAPLAVRRTPENPRLRSLSKAVPKEPEPVLQFEEPVGQPAPLPQPRRFPRRAGAGGVSGTSARLLAAVADHAILGVIDVTVLYFTLKVAAVSPADWQQIPLAPMIAFLLLLKVLYFSAFTAVGGQTIGKMGSGIRVITDDGSVIDPTRALRRSVAGLLSLATLGAGFLPAILGDDRRAIHDRVAGTRVVVA